MWPAFQLMLAWMNDFDQHAWHLQLQGRNLEAEAGDIDPEKKTLVACFPADAGMDE